MRQHRGRQDVALRGARRKSGGRSDALDVEDQRRDLGVVAQAGELAHQRDAGARRGRHRARARPARADDHAERRDLVFRLHDGEGRLTGRLVHAVLAQQVDQRLAERRRGRDRIPGDDGDAGHEAADRRRRVALDQDLAGRRVHPLDAERGLRLEVFLRVVEAGLQRGDVERQRLLLLPELPARAPSPSRPARSRAGRRRRRRRSCCGRDAAAWRPDRRPRPACRTAPGRTSGPIAARRGSAARRRRPRHPGPASGRPRAPSPDSSRRGSRSPSCGRCSRACSRGSCTRSAGRRCWTGRGSCPTPGCPSGRASG